MSGFFKRLFSKKDKSKESDNESVKIKNTIQTLKYDGMKAARSGQIDYAIQFFNKILEYNPEDSDALLYLIQIYMKSDRLDLAEKHNLKLIEIGPDLIEPQTSLAHNYLMQKRYPEVIDVCKPLIEKEPQQIGHHYLTGVAYYHLDDEFNAIASLTLALQIEPYFVEGLLLRATILSNMGQYKEALKDIDQLLERAKDNEEAIYLKGTILHKAGTIEEALIAYEKSIELNPFHIKAYINRATLLVSLNRSEEAMKLLDEAVEVNPTSGKIFQVRGQLKLECNDKEGALKDFTEAIRIDPTLETELSGEFHSN